MSVTEYMALSDDAEADHRVRYGDGLNQFDELWIQPETGPFPTAILIHGGCWKVEFDLKPLNGLARAFKDEGAAVWKIESVCG